LKRFFGRIVEDGLAYADTRELNERTLTDLGWLLMTFGEMGCQLQNARQLLEENLTRVREEGREAG
jgi:hypothetical protein